MANYSGAAGALRKLTNMTMKFGPLNSTRGTNAGAHWTHFGSYFHMLTGAPLMQTAV